MKHVVEQFVYNYMTSPSEKEIDRDFILIDILDEYVKIQMKISNLSRAKRNHIEYKYRKLIKSENKKLIEEYVNNCIKLYDDI